MVRRDYDGKEDIGYIADWKYVSCRLWGKTPDTISDEETSEESDGGAYVINGGDPWIDSNLKDNVINTGKLSEKDDFNVAINYDWIISHDIPEGYSRYSSFTKIGEIVEEKAITALDDDTLTGHDLK